MEENIKRNFILCILCVLLMFTIFNGIKFCLMTTSEYVEYKGIITMKWIDDKLLNDHYKLEIDGSIVKYTNSYEWYKYEKGDEFIWKEKEYTYPSWWVLW